MSKFVVHVPEVHMQPYVVEGEDIETAEEAFEVMSTPGEPEGVDIRYDKDDAYLRHSVEPDRHFYEVVDDDSGEQYVFDSVPSLK